MKSLQPVELVENLRNRLAGKLGLTSSEPSENSFYLEADMLVPSAEIKSTIACVLKDGGYDFDAARQNNILLFNEQKCLGWVTFCNFSGQEPCLIVVSVSDVPRNS